MDSSSFLAALLSRYKNIETNYLGRPFEDSDQLKAAIVDVYGAILVYSAAVKRAQQESKVRRIFATLEALSGQPLQILKNAVNANDGKVEMWRQLIGHQYRLTEFEEIDQKADAILKNLDQRASDLAAMNKSFLTTDTKQLLEWVPNR